MIAARNVDDLIGGGHADIDLGVGIAETTKPRHQPAGGKRIEGIDGEPLRCIDPQQPYRRGIDRIEALAQGLKVGLSLGGQPQTAIDPVEQRQAEPLLECFDLVADRRLCHVQLPRRLGEAQMAGGSLEGAQGVQRWQTSAPSTNYQ